MKFSLNEKKDVARLLMDRANYYRTKASNALRAGDMEECRKNTYKYDAISDVLYEFKKIANV